MALFDNFDQEEFLYFVQNFNMTLVLSGTLAKGAKIQCLCSLVCVESLRQIEYFSSDMGGTNPLTVETIILGLVLYFFT